VSPNLSNHFITLSSIYLTLSSSQKTSLPGYLPSTFSQSLSPPSSTHHRCCYGAASSSPPLSPPLLSISCILSSSFDLFVSFVFFHAGSRKFRLHEQILSATVTNLVCNLTDILEPIRSVILNQLLIFQVNYYKNKNLNGKNG